MKQLLFTCLISLTLFACQDKESISIEGLNSFENNIQVDEPTLNLTIDIPSVQTELLLLIQTEYTQATKDYELSNVESYKEYFQNRLIEFYPDDFTKVKFEQIDLQLEDFIEEYNEFLKQSNSSETPIDISKSFKSKIPFTSITEELKQGRVSSKEAERFTFIEELSARSKSMEKTEVLKQLNLNNTASQRISGFQLVAAAALWPVTLYHIWLAADRTNERRLAFFGNKVDGEKSDAFEHIYSSMQLRKYLTKEISKFVMETYETLNPNSYAGDTGMDLHNNFIGRDSKYDIFRGGINDTFNHDAWARRVRDYVNSCRQGMPLDVQKNWIQNTFPTTVAGATTHITSISSHAEKYAYYKNTCTDFICADVSCVSGFTCVNGNCVPETNDGSDDPNDDWTSDDNGDDGGGIGIIRCGSQICDVGYVCVNGQCTPT